MSINLSLTLTDVDIDHIAKLVAAKLGASAAPVAALAPVAPPAAPVMPAPVAAPPPVAAPVAPPAAPTAHDQQDLDTLAAGWSIDVMKGAMAACVQKHGAEGPQRVMGVLKQFGAERLTNGPNSLAPKHFPAAHAQLSA